MTRSFDVIVVGGGPVGAACRAGAGARRPTGPAARGRRRTGPGVEGGGRHAGATDRGGSRGPAARARPRGARAVPHAGRPSCWRRPASISDSGRKASPPWRPTRRRRRTCAPVAPGSGSRGTSATGSTPRRCGPAGRGSAPRAARSSRPYEGALEPARLVEALCRDAERVGATLEQDTVTGLETRGDRIIGVVGRRGRYSAPSVVLAAGAWSPTLDGLPRPLAIAPVRGQMAALPWPADRAPRHHLRPRRLHRRPRRRGDRRLDHGVRRLSRRGDERRTGAGVQRRHRALARGRSEPRCAAPGRGSAR